MVGAAGLVAIGYGGFFAQKQRAIAGQRLEPPIQVFGVNFQVLTGIAVRDFYGFFSAVTQHNLAIIAPCGTCCITCRGGKQVNQLGHFLHDFFCQASAGCEKPRWRFMTMFCLSYKVAGDNGRVRSFVSNDADLGGARKNVNAHFAEQGSFGFCYKFIPWSHDHIRRLASEQTIGHSCNGLHASQRHDDVGAGLVERVKKIRVHRATAEGPRTGDDGFHTCCFSSCYPHVSTGNVSIPTCWRVTASHVHWQYALTCGHSRVQFDLKLGE